MSTPALPPRGCQSAPTGCSCTPASPSRTCGTSRHTCSSLGVTDCYCSPPFAARPGSTHGYDITNHNELNPELGGRAGVRSDGRGALRDHDLGLILDFVPNHMGNDARTNGWWRDVLENGPSSPFARVFDIDWDPLKPELKNRLLLPDPRRAVRRGARAGPAAPGIRRRCAGPPLLRPPAAHQSSPWRRWCSRRGLEALVASLGEGHRQLREFLSILTRSGTCRPTRRETPRSSPSASARRRWRASGWCGSWPSPSRSVAMSRRPSTRSTAPSATRAASTACTTCSSSRPTASRTGARPPTRSTTGASSTSTSWRACASRTPRVFDHVHELVLQLVRRWQVTGLRLDHIDGLFDPAAYLERLRDSIRRHARRRRRGQEPGAAVLRGGREDPVGRRDAAAGLGHRRHDRLQLPERRQRPVRRRASRAAPAADLPAPDRGGRRPART